MEQQNQPITFTVVSIKPGDKVGIVNVNVKFNDNGQIYSYYRKSGREPGCRFVVIDGCRVRFTEDYKLINVEREYNTKGKRNKTSTEGQIKKNRRRRVKELPEIPTDPAEKTETKWDDFELEEWDSDDDDGLDIIRNHDFDVEKQEEEEAEWKRLEAEEAEARELEELKGEIHHDKYEQIKMCLNCNIPVYLAGPAGSGKNHTVEQIANEMGWNFYFSNSIQQEYKLTGFIDAGGDFHDTEFYKACTDEKECVFFLDEIDASIPDVLVLLNAAIANGYFEFPNGRVDFEHVHFVAAGNTVGSGADDMYTGRMVLDQATLDRFAIIEFDYCEKIEKKLTDNNKELIGFIHRLRQTAESKGIRATFSYRCMTMVTRLEKAGMPLEQIMRIAIMKGLDKDTINTFKLYDDTSKYNDALKSIQS